MKCWILCLAATIAALASSGLASAEAKPEFKLGFKLLARQVPDIVGQPLDNEHYTANGDSLQLTTRGLLVWHRADNLTAFTDGYRTWVLGPLGLRERLNTQTFNWEEPPLASTREPSSAAVTGSPLTQTATPSPTLAPTPSLASSQPNVIQGAGQRARTLSVLGEIHNRGSAPAYNLTVTAHLLSASGEVVGTGSQLFPYLGPGDTVGYRIDVNNPGVYTRADVSIDSDPISFAGFGELAVAWKANEQIHDTSKVKKAGICYQFTGTVTNNNSMPVSLSSIYAWFLDDQNRPIWMDYRFVPLTLAPGESHTFTIGTPWSRDNPQVPAITQVRYYAAGQLP